MGREVINVLIGINDDHKADIFMPGIKWTLEQSGEIEVSRNDRACTVEQLDNMLKTGIYDVLFCSEEMGDRQVAYGSISNWEQSSLKRIILIVKDSRYGSPKCGRLFENGYYDAIYTEGLKDPEYVIKLVKNGRTREEALEYYGVEDKEDTLEPIVEPEVPTAKPEPERNLHSEMVADWQALLASEESVFGKTAYEEKPIVPIESEPEVKVRQEDSMVKEEEPVMQSTEQPVEEMPVVTEVKTEPKPQVVSQERVADEKTVEKDKEDVQESHSETDSVSGESDKIVSKEVRLDENSVMVVTRVQGASVVPHEAYVVAAVSDSALVIEVPGAHFGRMKSALPSMPITVIMPRLWDAKDVEE